MRTLVIPFVLVGACAQTDSIKPTHFEQAATPSPEVVQPTALVVIASPPPRDAMLEWIRTKLPAGGDAQRDEHGALVVTHEAREKDTTYSVAKAYVALTSVYLASDLATRIGKLNGAVIANKKVTIPDVIDAPYKSPEEERLPVPADKSLRAIYLGGRDALGSWETTLDRLKARDMNAVILDGKAYMGEVTYPSNVDVANKTGAVRDAPITDLARTIRFAHQRGVHVIMRVSCFHDPSAAVKAPELSIKGYWGGPYPIGWLDPGDERAQKYIFDLIEEEIALGADEINLDYVRYPVQGGLGNADFHLKDRNRTKIGVIHDFVHHAHELTKAHGVPLSIDIFGVTATGTRQDIEALGQDIAVLGPEVEALMPMVYPSHYDKGFYGWEFPGNHPEIVAIGTRAALVHLREAKEPTSAVIRPWLQAFNWKSPEYSPQYLAQETIEAKKGGGVGYAMWNPGGYYGDAWNAIKPK